MISLEQYKKVLGSGLLLDHYLVLCSLRDGLALPKSKRVDGFINLLNKKGYIEDGILTERAYEVIDVHPTLIVADQEIETPKFDYGQWATDLHSKVQKKMIDLVGKVQVQAIIKGAKKGYPFMVGVQDFTTRLFKIISDYKLKDMDIIEKAVLQHVDNCYNSGEWFPLMKYYIYKKGEGSPLVADIENGLEDTGPISETKSNQKFI